MLLLGYDQERVEDAFASGLTELIAFGLPCINKVDLLKRFENNYFLSQNIDVFLFYSAVKNGFTDYLIFKTH